MIECVLHKLFLVPSDNKTKQRTQLLLPYDENFSRSISYIMFIHTNIRILSKLDRLFCLNFFGARTQSMNKKYGSWFKNFLIYYVFKILEQISDSISFVKTCSAKYVNIEVLLAKRYNLAFRYLP